MNMDTTDLLIITKYLGAFQCLPEMGLGECDLPEVYEDPPELEPTGTLTEWLH